MARAVNKKKVREDRPLKPSKGERAILDQLRESGGFLTKDYYNKYRLLDRDRNPIRKFPLSRIDKMVSKCFLDREGGIITLPHGFTN